MMICSNPFCPVCATKFTRTVANLKRVRSERHMLRMRMCFEHNILESCPDCAATHEDATANRIAAWVEGCGMWARGIADCIREGRWR